MSKPKQKSNTPSAVNVGQDVLEGASEGLIFGVRPLSVCLWTSFSNKLAYTVETVLSAAVEQAVLFGAAANYRVVKMRARAAAEIELERIRADVELTIRKQARDTDEKVTEGHIKALLTANKTVQYQQNRVAEAEAEDEYAKLLLEAYRHRRDSLEVVGQQSGAERAMSRMVEEGLQESRRELREKYRG